MRTEIETKKLYAHWNKSGALVDVNKVLSNSVKMCVTYSVLLEDECNSTGEINGNSSLEL
jgi:hypothetical protein